MVNRQAERAQLDGLLEHARAGASAAVVVRGEAGVGKTALVDYVRRSASTFRVVRAAGVESEMELPFAALQQLCAPMLDELARLPDPQREALSTAFGLRDGAPPNRFLVGLAVLSLFADAAEKQPLVCLVDDAQWLDMASAQVLGFAARRLTAEAVVIMFAVREPWEGNDLAGLAELTVGPLGDDHARDLLASAIAGRLDEAVRERILAEAQGNPLALLELPRAWTPAAFAGGFGLPDNVSVSARIEESFRRRLTPLPHDSRRLLLLAAADPTGDAGLIWSAADRLGISPSAAAAPSTAGLLDESNLRFPHPLVRSVVYQEAALGERRLVHRALAEVTDPDQDPDRRVWHLATASPGPDEEIARELELSASRAQARGGLAAAAAFLKRSVALTRDPELRAERAVAAAEASFQAGALESALALAATVESGPHSVSQRARVDLIRGEIAFASGAISDAPRLLLTAASRLEIVDMQLARETYLLALTAATVAGDLGGSGVLAEISDAVKALPARPGGPHALDLLLDGLALLLTDGHGAAAPTLRQASSALMDIPLDGALRWGWVAPAASNAMWDNDRTRAISGRLVQLVRDAGALAGLPLHLQALACANAWTGDFEAATLNVAEAQSVALAIGSQLFPWALLRLRGLQGREPEASAAIADAIIQAGGMGASVWAHWAAAVLYNGLGRYEEAKESARRCTSNAHERWVSVWALPELVEAATRVGDLQLAREAVDRLVETTQPSGTDIALGLEARCRALVTEGPGAEALYAEAVDRLSRTSLRPELARAHLVYGEWLRRQGRRVDARAHLRAAYDLFSTIGMEAFAERSRRELVATGETVRKRSVETQDLLTPQELQIARLAIEGRTNAEIGAELFLSRRTVEWHLRKVFDKLEIRSRRELPRALRR
jgi:DNA-binding CsgD family transcriptional regulator/tetratricopeptide (TPR) repeat protein